MKRQLQLEEALVEALDLLEQGTPVTKILSQYEELAHELRPFLMTAVDLERLAEPAAAAAQETSKQEFLRYAAAMGANKRPPVAVLLRKLVAAGLAAVFLLFACGAILATGSYRAVPGDTLYGSKLLLEEVRLNRSANPEEAQALIEAFQQERVREVAALLALGRHESVTFSGVVGKIDGAVWTIEGIPVTITAATVVNDESALGSLVQVRGKTADGVFLADEIGLYGGIQPAPDLNNPLPPAKPSATPTVEPTQTPERPVISQPDAGLATEWPAPTITPVDTHEETTAVEDDPQQDASSASGETEAGTEDSGLGARDGADDKNNDDAEAEGSGSEDGSSEDGSSKSSDDKAHEDDEDESHDDSEDKPKEDDEGKKDDD